MDRLSHVDDTGRASMVDVSGKQPQLRVARASGFISLKEATLEAIRDNTMKKGDVLSVAEIGGIQAAKRTSDLIPLCHPLRISKVDVKAQIEDEGVRVTSKVVCIGRTGVEMEALTAVSVALLTVYDMCKAVDTEMVLTDVRLVEKTKESLGVVDEGEGEDG